MSLIPACTNGNISNYNYHSLGDVSQTAHKIGHMQSCKLLCKENKVCSGFVPYTADNKQMCKLYVTACVPDNSKPKTIGDFYRYDR